MSQMRGPARRLQMSQLRSWILLSAAFLLTLGVHSSVQAACCYFAAKNADI
ncbi:MAG: hypothetical protein ACFCD0_04445 [Gemmataceae bacterium]